MLIITPKIGQVVEIGEVKLVVKKVRGSKVTLGIKSPPDQKVIRKPDQPPSPPSLRRDRSRRLPLTTPQAQG